jgi:hypothetical protein
MNGSPTAMLLPANSTDYETPHSLRPSVPSFAFFNRYRNKVVFRCGLGFSSGIGLGVRYGTGSGVTTGTITESRYGTCAPTRAAPINEQLAINK